MVDLQPQGEQVLCACVLLSCSVKQMISLFSFLLFIQNAHRRFTILLKFFMLLYICYEIHYIEIMVAVQTIKGNPFIARLCTRRMSPSGLIALLDIGSKFLSCMESLAHHEIGFNLIVFAILAFL